MRQAFALMCLVGLVACDPTIKSFDVTPAQLSCPGPVTLAWHGDADGGRLEADQTVSPPFPATVLKQGTLVEQITKTTTFTFFYPSAAHREKSVTVTSATCPSTCGPRVLTFTGTCSSGSGPSYVMQNLGAAEAPGNITEIISDADFPVHVQHAANDIALGAGGGPIGPLPTVPAAGGYTISVRDRSASTSATAPDRRGVGVRHRRST